jgi:diguanylate cyclase (GGDEF)-like protein
VWIARLADPAVLEYDDTVEQVIDRVLSGTTSTLLDDPAGLQASFANGATWGSQLTELMRAAGTDLRAEGTRQAHRASRDLRTTVGLAGLVTVVSIAAALQLARIVARPTRRLEVAAQAIHDGRFDLPPLAVGGPRELADTASAFNEMTSTLAAVEAHTVALADDPDAPVLGEALPGRTGRALQVALNRLRASMQAAEQHRLDLQEAATHDSLTGLLNRSAALEVVRRDLPRVAREGGAVVALFLDLDGLKAINDGHGHAAGDDALRMTADALRSSTRATDVVARLGGDEFLVTGIVHDVPAEVDALAQRIHRAVGAKVLRCATEELPLQCSIGVALADASDSVDSLIQKADAALYDAKRRGRGRIAWSDGDPSPLSSA